MSFNTTKLVTFWSHGQFRFLYFCSSQFGHSYFQLRVNSVPPVNSLTENAYVTSGVLCWHTCGKKYI